MLKDEEKLFHSSIAQEIKKERTKEMIKETAKKDDILNIVEQFVQYFEKIDRGEKDGHSILNS